MKEHRSCRPQQAQSVPQPLKEHRMQQALAGPGHLFVASQRSGLRYALYLPSFLEWCTFFPNSWNYNKGDDWSLELTERVDSAQEFVHKKMS